MYTCACIDFGACQTGMGKVVSRSTGASFEIRRDRTDRMAEARRDIKSNRTPAVESRVVDESKAHVKKGLRA